MMKILFLSRWFPWPADNGSRQRAFHIIRHLNDHAVVDLHSFTQQAVSGDSLAVMRQFCRHIATFDERRPAQGGWRSMPALLSSTPRGVRQSFSPAFQQATNDAVARHNYDVVLAAELG
ncbi:MAG: hypothetical protein ACRC1H_20090, partial [Caldilineaceae bacterium]